MQYYYMTSVTFAYTLLSKQLVTLSSRTYKLEFLPPALATIRPPESWQRQSEADRMLQRVTKQQRLVWNSQRTDQSGTAVMYK